MRGSLLLAAAGTAAILGFAYPVTAQGLLPPNLFSAPVDPNAPTAIEAVTLTIDSDTGLVIAEGDVVVAQGGYTATGERLIYNRNTGDVRFEGPASIRDPSGNLLEGEDLEVTGDLRLAFINSLTITTYDGAQITADSADYDEAVRTILNNATYTPCGDCIDDKGRRIGWSIRAARFIQNNDDNSIELEQPTLAILGIPVAWLPYLWLPDAGTAFERIEMPSYGYAEELGSYIRVPYTAYSSRYTDVILTPMLMSRQGFLMEAEWVQRFDTGSFNIKASGVYQFDPGAFTWGPAQERWRGALQTTGSFRPIEDWLVGWSYTNFTDAAYLGDYKLSTADASINQVYATHLSQDTYFDIRLQQFNELGDIAFATQERQGRAIPNVRFDNVTRLADGWGQLELTGRLLGVQRGLDHTATTPAPFSETHVLGFEGEKLHAMAQAGWQNQWIAPMGVEVTPYVGVRLDAASYSGGSAHALAPGSTSFLSATPIAAMDVRWPWAGTDGSTVHLVEPIAQIAYRGTSQSMPGITNDDAQSFVFDDTNLFSYNRFSGADRQETGLRANLGGRYLVDFANGSYLELIGGQSFHLAGVNAFTIADPAMPGATRALAANPSYAVLGAYAGITPYLKVGGKLEVDPANIGITRAGLGAQFSAEGYTASLDYFYLAGNPAAGVPDPQHEIGGELGIPLMDYWRATAGAHWDLAANTWLQVSGGLQYDDGYLQIGANATMTGPTHNSPDDLRITANFLLKAPAGFEAGYSGPISLPLPQ
jgi:LPS-assembly protein